MCEEMRVGKIGARLITEIRKWRDINPVEENGISKKIRKSGFYMQRTMIVANEGVFIVMLKPTTQRIAQL